MSMWRQFVGYYKDQTPGANKTIGNYQVVINEIKATLLERKNSQDLSLVKNYIKGIVYPDKEGETLDILNSFIEMYNDVYTRKVREDLNIGDTSTYKRDLDSMKQKIIQSHKYNQNRKRETIRVYNQVANDMYKKQREAVNNLKTGGVTLKQNLDEIEGYRKIIEGAMREYLNELEEGSPYKVENLEEFFKKFKESSKMITSFVKDEDRANVVDALQNIDRVFSQIEKNETLSTTTIGDLWEYFLAVISEDGLDTAENIVTDTFKQKKKDIKDNRVFGGERVDRGGSIFDLKISDDLGVTTEETDKKGKTITKMTIGNATFKYTPIANTGEASQGKKQGKMDLLFKVSDDSSLRVSAKNWNSLYQTVIDENNKSRTIAKSIGETDLLGAVSRTSGWSQKSREMSFYTLAWQYPKDAKRQEELLTTSRQFTNACFAADVLVGYSQKNNYADTLIILDRNKKDVHVINIINVLYNMIDKSNYNNGSFVIDGVDYDEIYNNAIAIRQETQRQIQLYYAQNLNSPLRMDSILPAIQGLLHSYKASLSINPKNIAEGEYGDS